MGIKNAVRLGKKYIGGAIRIGKKVYGLYKRVMGSKEVEKSTEAEDTYGNEVKSLSSEDFKGETHIMPDGSIMLNKDHPPDAPLPQLQPNTPRQLERATGIEGLRNKVKAGKIVSNVLSKDIDIRKVKEAKLKAQRLLDSPSKKSVKKVSKEQREIQQSLNINSMSKKEFKKYQKKQEKLSKKADKKRRKGQRKK